MELERIPFKVVSVSSEEDDFNASELTNPRPTCKGWRSAKYCIYPQDLILQFEDRVTIDRIQILKHAFMVPSSIELQLGDVPPSDSDRVDFKKASFMSLGVIPWNMNMDEKDMMKETCRQMRTIEFSGSGQACRGSFLKMVLNKNLINRKNEYNQISLIGINILANAKDDLKSKFRKQQYQDLLFLMYMDPDTIQVMLELEEALRKSEKSGREQKSRQIKSTLKELEIEGHEIGALISQKKVKVEKSKYDDAKTLKQEIIEKRSEVFSRLRVVELIQMEDPVSIKRSENLPPASKHKVKPRSRSNSVSGDLPKRTEPLPPPRSPRSAPTPPKSRSPSPPKPIRRPPIQGHIDTRQIRPSKEMAKRRNSEEAEDKYEINGKDYKEMMVAIEIYGQKTIWQIVNKSPQLKEEGCDTIAKMLEGFYGESGSEKNHTKPEKVVRGTAQALERIFKEKLWSVFGKGIAIHNYLFDSFIQNKKVPKHECLSTSERMYNVLLARTNDTNERFIYKAEEAIIVMLKCAKVRNLGTIQTVITKPLEEKSFKDQVKQTLSRVELTHKMISDLGMLNEKYLSVKIVSKFAASAMNHPSVPVRKSAEKILLKLYKLDPDQVLRALPRNTDDMKRSNQMVFNSLMEKFKIIDDELED